MYLCVCLQLHRPVYGPHPPRSLRGQSFFREVVEAEACRRWGSVLGDPEDPERELRRRGTLRMERGVVYLSGRRVPQRLKEPCVD